MSGLEPHKLKFAQESEEFPNLPRAVLQSMVSGFFGFWIPFIPPVFSIMLGLKILRITREQPEKYTGRTYGWFAIILAVLQIAGWGYLIGIMLGWFPQLPGMGPQVQG